MSPPVAPRPSGFPRSAYPARSLPPGGAADAYADLLRDTRGLRREQANAREQWIARLPENRREEALFELEVLLKGLACFANPRNHPGVPKRAAIVAQDYREALALARDGMQRVVALSRLLLGDQERAFVFQRYLEMLLPDDGARSRLVRGSQTQDTPEESLFVLRHALTNLLEVTGAVVRLPRVPFRTFYATLSVAQREVGQSAFFNPLAALEFRPEFDRITNQRVLELMRQVPGEQARKLVALTILSLFRMLRYLTLLDHVVREPRPAGNVFLILSVLRSDARALTDYLRKQAGEQLADSYERELFKVPASQIAARYEEMLAEAHRLVAIKATLEGIAANLRLELRRTFEHDLPAADGKASSEQLRAAVAAVGANLRPALQNAVLVLGKALGARLDEHGVFDDAAARRSLSTRLRRDVWMFAQIARAFSAKARATPTREDRWSGPSSLQFVREFLSYFDAMGYPLLRAADYPRFDAFIAALGALEETDLLDPQRLEGAVAEAEQFYVFLTELFAQIGERDELKGVPFDRRAAAEALRLYLGD
ncbi:MAG: hypothetical protein JWP97_1353 [Labilithrix sp.]|nr:hypothetical protein [Labilithrix sp.]